MRRLAIISFLVAAASAAVVAQPPDPAQMAMQFGDNSKKNAKALRQYSWKMRTEVTVKGEPKSLQLYQMRFDADGRPQKTPISGEQVEKKKVRGPVRKRVVKTKISKAKEYVGKVTELVQSYNHPSAGTMLDFFNKATFTPTSGGLVEVKGGDFLQPDDEATFWIDAATGTARTFSFRTTMEGDPINGQVDFETLQNGPSYAARTTISMPAKNLKAVVENFDHLRQQ